MNREFKIGIVVVVALAALYWGGTFLGGSNPFKEKNEYHAYYKNVGGLLVSNEVRFQGFKVGRVSDISFSTEHMKWLVTFSVNESSLTLMDSTVARVGSADILGTMIIELKNINKGAKKLEIGSFMRSAVEKDLQEQVNDQLKPLVVKVESLIGTVDSVINTVGILLNERTIGNIHNSLEKIPVAMNNLLQLTRDADTIMSGIKNARIGQTLQHVNSIAANFRKNNDALTKVFTNLESITDSLAKANVKQTLSNLNKVVATVDSITADIQAGKGSIGLLLKDEGLYNKLAYSVADMDMLLLDIRTHPKRYFHFSMFGKKNKKQKPLARDSANYVNLFPPLPLAGKRISLDSLFKENLRKMVEEAVKKENK